MLGLRRDLASFYKLAKRDPRLAPLVEEFRGLKPPRFPSVFETVVNGIACQQLSLLVGILLLSRLAHKYGRALGPSNDSLHAFPGPADLSGVRSQSIRALGFSGHKANFLLRLSSAIRDQSLDLEQLARLDNEAAVDFLQDYPVWAAGRQNTYCSVASGGSIFIRETTLVLATTWHAF